MTKKGRPIATTNDPFGNVVTTTSKTLKHIEKEHPEMAGRLADIQKVIKAPQQVRETPFSSTFNAFAFEEGSTNGNIRVLVAYDTPNLFTGTATGYVSTAYPIDISRGSAVTKVIWTAAATTATGSKKP